MLVLSRKTDQEIVIANDIVLTVVAVKGNRVSLGIKAPDSIRIQRSELLTNESCCLHASNTAPRCRQGLDATVDQAVPAGSL